MTGIICKFDGDAKRCFPIVKDEDGAITGFETIEEAYEFAENSTFCRNSDVIFIDLDVFEFISR